MRNNLVTEAVLCLWFSSDKASQFAWSWEEGKALSSNLKCMIVMLLLSRQLLIFYIYMYKSHCISICCREHTKDLLFMSHVLKPVTYPRWVGIFTNGLQAVSFEQMICDTTLSISLSCWLGWQYKHALTRSSNCCKFEPKMLSVLQDEIYIQIIVI